MSMWLITKYSIMLSFVVATLIWLPMIQATKWSDIQRFQTEQNPVNPFKEEGIWANYKRKYGDLIYMCTYKRK